MPLRRISPRTRLYELRLRDTTSGRWANFADVGFGIGQALPVLVEGLRTPPGGLFLVQEPEIHLHPDAQLAMADFLIDLCRAGRHVIVETHSEAVLLRVRKVIAEAADDHNSILKPEHVSVVYVTSKASGGSRAEQLDLDALGRIPEWPRGFMEDVTEERMQLLSTMATASTKE
jgi:predicted ATPase